MTLPTGFWTFPYNPKIWEIEEFLLDQNKNDTYWSRNHKKFFEPEQFGIIRVGIDLRTKKELNGKEKLKSGIYAIVKVISYAENRDYNDEEKKLNHKYWLNEQDHNGKYAVTLEIIDNLINHPIYFEKIEEYPLIKDESLIKGYRGVTILEKESFQEIQRIADLSKCNTTLNLRAS
jgi:hypothetical protein